MHAPFLHSELNQRNDKDDGEQDDGACRRGAETEIPEGIQVNGIYDHVRRLIGAALGEQPYLRKGLERADDVDDDLGKTAWAKGRAA